jgi:hypothetical protein
LGRLDGIVPAHDPLVADDDPGNPLNAPLGVLHNDLFLIFVFEIAPQRAARTR